jgi:hypothetical protein
MYYIYISLPTFNSGEIVMSRENSKKKFTYAFFYIYIYIKARRYSLSPWPIDSMAFSFTSNLDRIKVILSPGSLLHLPKEDHHYFQIFATLACDLFWTYRNKAYHEGLSFNELTISRQISKVALEHSEAWFSIGSSPVVEKWIPPPRSYFKINFDTVIRDTFLAQSTVC